MMKRVLLFILIFTGLQTAVWAQEKHLARADEAYAEYSFVPAIDIYQKVLDRGFESADLLRKLGDSYYFNANYVKAAEFYQQLENKYPAEMTAEYYFRYSQSLKSMEDYQGSEMAFKRFSELSSAEDARVKRFKSQQDYMDEIASNSGRYDLKDFQYNSVYSEFAPTFYKEGLIFSSDRDTGNLARYRHTWNSQDFHDLYKVNADSISEDQVTKLSNVNTKLHESTSVSTKDGSVIYFTRNNIVDRKYTRDEKGFIRLKIFRAKWIDGSWNELEELPFNSDSYSVANPALSPDEKTLYFASDMPGSFGQSDLYRVAINEDGTFGSPENLGPTINSEARETFPFITEEEILYFSSDGHPGLGGLDVFATNIEDSNYTKSVINVGQPVNSSFDDFSFIIDEQSREGYFASNRTTGMGGDDIYAFLETRPLVFECLQPLTGTVRDRISNQILIGATVKVIDETNKELISAITNSEGMYTLSCDCNQGNFVRAATQGYIPAEEYLG
ncbi:MAG: flagellar motor protein MotB, partial [Flavobacteriaceae bacterium]